MKDYNVGSVWGKRLCQNLLLLAKNTIIKNPIKWRKNSLWKIKKIKFTQYWQNWGSIREQIGRHLQKHDLSGGNTMLHWSSARWIFEYFIPEYRILSNTNFHFNNTAKDASLRGCYPYETCDNSKKAGSVGCRTCKRDFCNAEPERFYLIG